MASGSHDDWVLPKVSGRLICAYGELVRDQVALLGGPLPMRGQVPGIFSVRPGGAGPNVVVAASGFGVPTRFLGHCGYGPEAEVLLDRLRNAGVEVRGVFRGRYSSNLAIQHQNGDLTFIFDAGDRHLLQPSDVMAEWLDGCGILHINSFNLYDSGSRPAVARLVSLAAATNMNVSIDVGDVGQLETFGLDVYRMLLDRISPRVIFCNEHEADLLGAAALSRSPGRFVVEHRGADSTLVYKDGELIANVAVAPLEIPHTLLGAGDAFSGGFLAGWLQNGTLSQAVALGHTGARRLLTSTPSDTTTPVTTAPVAARPAADPRTEVRSAAEPLRKF